MTSNDLADLVGARRTGRGRWQARCPAHSHKSPSPSIEEARDGRAFVHCFAGCTILAVLAALGPELNDLHPGGQRS
jgi:hypothetical protein